MQNIHRTLPRLQTRRHRSRRPAAAARRDHLLQFSRQTRRLRNGRTAGRVGVSKWLWDGDAGFWGRGSVALDLQNNQQCCRGMQVIRQVIRSAGCAERVLPWHDGFSASGLWRTRKAAMSAVVGAPAAIVGQTFTSEIEQREGDIGGGDRAAVAARDGDDHGAMLQKADRSTRRD
jgi:hypothetical protein